MDGWMDGNQAISAYVGGSARSGFGGAGSAESGEGQRVASSCMASSLCRARTRLNRRATRRATYDAATTPNQAARDHAMAA
jgi:hypothetical protein